MKTNSVRETYNKKIRGEFSGRYENHRWHDSPKKRAEFMMTKKTIEHFLPLLHYKSYLEFGPGPGTWTKLFIDKNPNANHTLVELSDEMFLQLKKNLGKSRIVHSGFLEWEGKDKYDLIFSSRALEYIENKDGAISKIKNLLNDRGRGVIITKTPKYKRRKLLGKKPSDLHKGQISPEKLKKALEDNGLRVVSIYPTTLYFPLLNLVFLNKILFFLFGVKPLNPVSRFFSESYIIIFKHDN